MSGLIRNATGAVFRTDLATAFKRSNSGTDSILICKMSFSSARASSASVLPTPEKNDFVRRDAGLQCPNEFPIGNDIGPRPKGG